MNDVLLAQLNGAYEFFERSTRSLAEEDSAFTPSDGVFTVARQVAHTAQTIDWFMEGAFRPQGFDLDFERLHREVSKVSSLTEARAWLKRAVENARQLISAKTADEWQQPLPEGPVMGDLPRMAIMNDIADHTAHHRGALTVYARLLGKTPPNPYVETPA